MDRRTALFHGIAAACLASTLVLPAAAQDYPNKAVHVVIGFAAGSGADILTRFYATKFGEALGQPVVVENRPGTVGVIAATVVTKAKPDGYTMLWAGNSIMVGGKYLVKDFPFDAEKDLIPAGAFLETPFVLAVGAQSPAKSVAELVTLLKGKPKNLSAYTNPTGLVSTELFKARTGVQSTSVSFKTTADAIPDLVNGTLDYMILDGTFAVGQVKAGRIRVLAATSGQRITALPDVPTMSEAGVKDYVFSPWWGVYLPAGTPPAVVAKVERTMQEIARSPEASKFLDTLAALPVLDNAKEMTERLRSDRGTWDKLAVAADLKPE